MEQFPNSSGPSPKSNADDTLSAILELLRDRYSVPADRAGFTGMIKEVTAWDVYYNEAKKVDEVLIKRWNSRLSSLILFAAIFSAVLTAFIGQTTGLLLPDLNGISVEIALWTANQAANSSNGPLILAPFEPDPIVVTINCLFYGSLVGSLISVLACVVAMQWVHEYDVKATRAQYSPLVRAVRHHYRFTAVQRWRMDGVIRTLSILLYASVAMFLLGTIIYTYIINLTVGYIVASGAGSIVLLFSFSTVLAALTDAPFETSLSRALALFLHRISLFVHRTAWSFGIPLEETQFIKHETTYMGHIEREDDIIRSREKELADLSLEWLIHRLNISPDFHKRYSIILAECTERLATKDELSLDFLSKWVQIMHEIGRKHLMKRDADVTDADVREVKLLQPWFDNQKIQERFPKYYQTLKDVEVLVKEDDDTNAAMLLLRCLAATPNVGIRNGILLSRWKTSGWPVQSWSMNLDPRNETEFASLVNLFCRVSGHLPKGHEYTDSEVLDVLTRFTDIGLADTEKVSFEVARTLVHSFECVVVGVKQDTHYSTRILNTPEAYANQVVGKSHALHYKLLKLLVKTFQSMPEGQQPGCAKEVVSILWLGPAFLDGKSWKEICLSNGTPISEQQPLAIAEDANSSPDPEISRVIAILRFLVKKIAQLTEEHGTPYALDPSKITSTQTCIDAIRSRLSESTHDLSVIACIPFIELVCDGVDLVVNTRTAIRGACAFDSRRFLGDEIDEEAEIAQAIAMSMKAPAEEEKPQGPEAKGKGGSTRKK